MATKKAQAKKAPEKKEAPKQEAPKQETQKKAGRPPKLGEVTEMDLGPDLSNSVRRAAAAHKVDTGVIVRAMVKKTASELARLGPIGTRMALRKFM
jgi:hypothetical protein